MKVWKVFFGLGVALLLIGIIIFVIGFALNGWKFKVEYEMKTYVAERQNETLDLNLSAGEMKVEYYDGTTVEVEYPTSAAYGYEVTEYGGTVKVAAKRNRFYWFNWNKIPTVTVRIPHGDVMDLRLHVSAGKVTVADGEFNDVALHLSAGTINLGDLKCNEFLSHLSAGTLDASALECRKLDLKLSAGSADLDKIKCGYINVKLSAGSANLNIIGSLNEYLTNVNKSAGSCNLPERLLPPGGVDNFKHIDVSLSAGSANFFFTD